MSARFTTPDEASTFSERLAKKLNAMVPRKRLARFARKWILPKQNPIELLLPQMRRDTKAQPVFSFESPERLDVNPATIRDEVAALQPWVYQFEFGDVATKGVRDDTDWLYHRYRADLLMGAIADLLGDRISSTTAMDVACHCGPFALELAMRGAKSVLGLDLRPENVAQANFLAKSFAVPNVEFRVLNVRNLATVPKVDVAFCGGLLYHVTFPLELLRDLHDACTDFLVLDTLVHLERMSSFHLVLNKPVAYSAEGETHYEFMPTYRAVIDGLRAVGFEHIVEVIGERAAEIPGYRDGNVRSFIAFKSDGPTYQRIRDSFPTL